MASFEQTIIWTALPNGVVGNMLQLSVFVSPRLSGNAASTLQSFKDFLDWPARIAATHFQVQFADDNEHGGVTLSEATPPQVQRKYKSADPLVADSAYWHALFDVTTTVRSHSFDNYSERPISSYQIAHIADFLRNRYADAGLKSLILPPDVKWLQESKLLEQMTLDVELRELALQMRGQPPVDVSNGPVVQPWGSRGKLRVPQGGVLEADSQAAPAAPLPLRERLRLGRPVEPPEPQLDFARFYQYHGTSSAAGTRNVAKAASGDEARDFHDAVAAMGHYPELLRKLGLVVDLLIPLAPGIGTRGVVRVWPDWNAVGSTNLSPWSAYAYWPNARLGTVAFESLSGLSDSEIDSGMLRLERPDFSLVEFDVDGAAIKAMDFAQNLPKLANAGKASGVAGSDIGGQVPAAFPSLRSSGISLVQRGRADTARVTLVRAASNNDAAEAARRTSSARGDAAPRALGEAADNVDHHLYAEDLLRGYRIDVYDEARKQWFSLCRGDGHYRFKGLGIRPWISKDTEGIVQLAVTSGQDDEDPVNGPLNLHEALFRWEGWSLCAPRPGGRVKNDGQPELPPPAVGMEGQQEYFANEPDKDFGFSASFRVTKGSLPRLRFGGRYRVRARAVDLAGNSLTLDAANAVQVSDSHVIPPGNQNPFVYTRFEPVSPPTVVPTEVFDIATPGESPARLVIRSDWNKTAAEYPAELEKDYPEAVRKLKEQGKYDPKLMPETFPAAYRMLTTERYLAPPKATQALIETHGMFDDPQGQGGWNAASYQIIQQREAGTSPEMLPTPQPGQTQPALPYLPDPIARGVVLRGFAGVLPKGASFVINASGEVDPPRITKVQQDLKQYLPEVGALVRVDFERENDVWYDLKLFRLRVADPASAPQDGRSLPVTWDKAERVLTVYVPKAEVVTVDISSVFPELELRGRGGPVVWSLEHLGIWQLLQERNPPDLEGQRAAARNGCHWMLSPSRELTLVHAVQHPLIAPDLTKLINPAPRQSDQTFAWVVMQDILAIDGKSTVKVDIEASWEEPIDDLSLSKWKKVKGSAHVFEVPVEQGKPGVKIQDAHHFGDTKHRMVNYTAVATSRFREYFPPGVELTRSGSQIINVQSSARPAPPKVHYIVPAFGWEGSGAASPDGKITSTRHGGGLRVYLDRPWYSSGDGEMLGVVTYEDANKWVSDEATRTKFGPYVSQWGTDPIWMSPAPSALLTADHLEGEVQYRYGAAPNPNVFLEELPDELLAEATEGTGTKVKVTGYGVAYDPNPDERGHQRQLWYCDIQINPGASYFPFVRLALVRYQPNSLPGVEISRVVLADFIQLAPNRTATITVDPTDPQLLQCTLAGTTYNESPVFKAILGPSGSAHVEISLEQRKPELGEDFGWVEAPGVTITGKRGFEAVGVMWAGSVRLPQTRTKVQYRLVIKEYEVFFADDGPTRTDTTTAKRLVYADILPL